MLHSQSATRLFLARAALSGLLVVGLLCGCVTAPDARQHVSTPSSTSPGAATIAADDNLNAVLWMQTSIEYDVIFEEIYRQAGDRLAAALADPDWNALPEQERTANVSNALPPAIILDIDETVLDNSPYQARLIREHAMFNESTWAKWCHEARARALPGVHDFLKLAASRDVTIYYISNRAQELDAATLANLRAEGLPVAGDHVFLGRGSVTPGCVETRGDKICRRRLVGHDHRVLMQFGDQIGDFVSISTNTPQGRKDAVAAWRDWFGERWFMLPNPTYGSWEPAVFGNDWTQSAEQRRRAKQAALHTD